MKKRFRIVLIDLECTCDEFTPQLIEVPEIIEIGSVICDLSADGLTNIDSLQLYVRPISNPTLTAFCTQLTGIEQGSVDSAKPLANTLSVLASWVQIS